MDRAESCTVSRHLIPRLTLGEAESLIQKHGKKGEVMRIFSILVDADKMLHDKGIEISKTHTVVPIADIQRSNAERRRLRIAHLRRMVHATLHVEERSLRNARRFADARRLYSVRERQIVGKMDRFRDACRAEIARLRGEG